MPATAENADPAISSVKKEESISSEFLKSEKEENAPLSTPFVTGLIKQEEAPAATKLGTDSEASSPSDLKKETSGLVNMEVREADEYEHVEAACVKDGVELANESYGISGMEFETEGVIVNEDSLDVVSEGDEEMKQAFTSDVSVSLMEYVLEKVSGVDKVLEVEDGLSPLWECKVVPDEDETMASALVGNIPIEIIMDEVWPKEDKLKTPELVNGNEDDRPQPGWDLMIIKDEAEAVTSAPVESTQMEIKMEDVPPEKGTLSAPALENDAHGPPPGCEETIIGDKVEPSPPASVESIPWEIKPDDEQPTEDMLVLPAPGLENDADGPPPGWEAMVVKNEVNPMPPLVKSIALDFKTEEMLPVEDTVSAPGLEIEDEDNEPPPGWEVVATKDCAAEELLVKIEKVKEEDEVANPLHGEESVAHSAPSPGLENDDDDNAPLPGLETDATENCAAEETLVKQETGKEEEENRLPGEESDTQSAPRTPFPCEAPSPTTELGQVVCGSCRSLLSYPKGAKYVQCLCCQTVSIVLEAHQVGQVYCGSCSTLLMYCFGSPAVQCSGCKFITQITSQNHRPPLSEQGVTLQSQLAQLRPRSTTNLAQ